MNIVKDFFLLAHTANRFAIPLMPYELQDQPTHPVRLKPQTS